MNIFISKRLLAVISAVALGCGVASAQMIEYSVPVSDFNKLVVTDDFELTVSSGDSYSLKLAVDQAFKNYVQVFNMEGQLNIGLDERKVPSDVKKKFSSKDAAAPVFRAYLTVPSAIASLSFADKASLAAIDAGAIAAEAFKLELKDNAEIASSFLSSRELLIHMENRSKASLEVKAENLMANIAGNSELVINQSTSSSEINQTGSSSLVGLGMSSSMTLSLKGSSKSVLNGSVPSVKYVISGTSTVNAVNLSSEESDVEMSGLCSLYEASEKSLKINISNGAKLSFSKTPAITVVNIKLASVTPYTETK